MYYLLVYFKNEDIFYKININFTIYIFMLYKIFDTYLYLIQ